MMSVNLRELIAAQKQVFEHLEEYKYHIDFKSRLTLIKKGKPLMAKYFKYSIALNTALHDKEASTEHLETTLRRYAASMNEEAKKIISIFLKYGHGCDSHKRLKFQTELAEVLVLLEHRLKNEREHLIPEYRILLEDTAS